MNLPVAILLIFALLGAVDKLLNNRFGLAEELDKGLTMMGSLALSMSGIYCFSIMLGEFLSAHLGWAEALPFDPSVIFSSVLAIDMGAYSITATLTSDPSMVLFTGVLLSSTLGTTISFTLPVALSGASRENTSQLMGGMVYGIVTVPVALVVGQLFLRLPMGVFLLNLLPVAVICGLLCAAIFLFKEATTRVFLFLGNAIRWLSVVLFVLLVAQIYLGIPFVRDALVSEILAIVFKITIVVCGSFILSKLVLRFFMGPILFLARKLHINTFAIIGLLLSLINSVSMFSIFDKMDRRGQTMNAAASVSGAYAIGGQLAFVAAVAPQATAVFLVAKLAAGAAALFLASRATRDCYCNDLTEN